MDDKKNWWEPVFSGELEIGINKEKIQDLEAEAFLYHQQSNQEMESQV